MIFFKPFQQDSREVQAHAHFRMRVQRFHKRAIGFLVGVFDDVVEVSNRLVRMD